MPPKIPKLLSDLYQDSNTRTVSDSQINSWNNAVNKLSSIIVEVDNPIDEAQAFANGALIVIRLDLLTVHEATLVMNQGGRSSVKVSTQKLQHGIASILISSVKQIVGMSRIAIKVTQGQYGLSRILVNSMKQQSIYGKGSIKKTESQVSTGTSNVTVVNTKQEYGQSRVTATNTKTQAGLAKVLYIIEKALNGNARVAKNVVVTQVGKANIYKQGTATQFQLGRSNITRTIAINQTAISSVKRTTTANTAGKSSIKNTTQKTIAGKTSVKVTSLKVLLGKSNITVQAFKTILAKSSILRATQTTALGKSRISITTTKTVTGLSKILDASIVSNKTVQGKSSIKKTATKTIAGRSSISAQIPNTGTYTFDGASGVSVAAYSSNFFTSILAGSGTANLDGTGNLLISGPNSGTDGALVYRTDPVSYMSTATYKVKVKTNLSLIETNAGGSVIALIHSPSKQAPLSSGSDGSIALIDWLVSNSSGAIACWTRYFDNNGEVSELGVYEEGWSTPGSGMTTANILTPDTYYWFYIYTTPTGWSVKLRDASDTLDIVQKTGEAAWSATKAPSAGEYVWLRMGDKYSYAWKFGMYVDTYIEQ